MQSWKDVEGVKSAIEASTHILKFYKEGASFEKVESYLRNDVYKFESGVANKKSAGSAPDYESNNSSDPGNRTRRNRNSI